MVFGKFLALFEVARVPLFWSHRDKGKIYVIVT